MNLLSDLAASNGLEWTSEVGRSWFMGWSGVGNGMQVFVNDEALVLLGISVSEFIIFS